MNILSGVVYYHGRTCIVKDYVDGGYIVYFSDTDNEKYIDKDELESQQ